MNTITLLKFRKQALKMQKAYKLYFSANLQLVIGKDSNDLETKQNKKPPLCHLPLPLPKAATKRKTRADQNQKNDR